MSNKLLKSLLCSQTSNISIPAGNYSIRNFCANNISSIVGCGRVIIYTQNVNIRACDDFVMDNIEFVSSSPTFSTFNLCATKSATLTNIGLNGFIVNANDCGQLIMNLKYFIYSGDYVEIFSVNACSSTINICLLRVDIVGTIFKYFEGSSGELTIQRAMIGSLVILIGAKNTWVNININQLEIYQTKIRGLYDLLAITPNRELVSFRTRGINVNGPLSTTAAPQILFRVTINGVPANENIVGLSLRTNNNIGFYILTISSALVNNAKVYSLDPGTGLATFVTNYASNLVGTKFGFDFNPTLVDGIRVLTNTSNNYVIGVNSPNVTVQASPVIPNSNPATLAKILSCGYTNSYPGSTTTVLYDLADNGKIYTQTPPSGSTLVQAYDLGSALNNNAALEITTLNEGFVAAKFINSSQSNLYSFDIATPTAIKALYPIEDYIALCQNTSILFYIDQNISIIINNIIYNDSKSFIYRFNNQLNINTATTFQIN